MMNNSLLGTGQMLFAADDGAARPSRFPLLDLPRRWHGNWHAIIPMNSIGHACLPRQWFGSPAAADGYFVLGLITS